MREINNNPNNLNFSGVQKADLQKDNQPAPQEAQIEEQAQPKVETQDLSQSPAAVSGRSLVSKGDSVENDIMFLIKNPEICAKANNFFETAEKQVGYENAAKLTEAFVKEFQNS